MKKVLLVLSSVREGRIADKILEQVKTELENYPELEVDVADFKEMPLPLIDTPFSPNADEFAPTDENVKKWTNKVEEADEIIFLVAEYNYSFTAILKNAIDWIGKPWNDKPVSYIGYGWAGGTRATKHLRDVMGSTLAARSNDVEANLYFTKNIQIDGSPIDDSAKEAINSVLKTL